MSDSVDLPWRQKHNLEDNPRLDAAQSIRSLHWSQSSTSNYSQGPIIEREEDKDGNSEEIENVAIASIREDHDVDGPQFLPFQGENSSGQTILPQSSFTSTWHNYLQLRAQEKAPEARSRLKQRNSAISKSELQAPYGKFSQHAQTFEGGDSSHTTAVAPGQVEKNDRDEPTTRSCHGDINGHVLPYAPSKISHQTTLHHHREVANNALSHAHVQQQKPTVSFHFGKTDANNLKHTNVAKKQPRVESGILKQKQSARTKRVSVDPPGRTASESSRSRSSTDRDGDEVSSTRPVYDSQTKYSTAHVSTSRTSQATRINPQVQQSTNVEEMDGTVHRRMRHTPPRPRLEMETRHKFFCVGIVLVMFGALVAVLALLLRPGDTQDDSRQEGQFANDTPVLIPSTSPTTKNSPTPTKACRLVEVNVVFDDYAGEISWDVRRVGVPGSNDTVLKTFKAEESLDSHTDSLCLEEGRYRYTIYDDAGDGLCCNGPGRRGYYNLTSYGALIARGAEFALNETVLFDIDVVPTSFPSMLPSTIPSQLPSTTSMPTQSPFTATKAPNISSPGTLLEPPLECTNFVEVSIAFENYSGTMWWEIQRMVLHNNGGNNDYDVLKTYNGEYEDTSNLEAWEVCLQGVGGDYRFVMYTSSVDGARYNLAARNGTILGEGGGGRNPIDEAYFVLP